VEQMTLPDQTELDMIKIFVPAKVDRELDPIIDWCNEQFTWDSEWLWEYDDGLSSNYNAIFYFTKPEHAVLFTLRWSGR
jgi:hypothetical protein